MPNSTDGFCCRDRQNKVKDKYPSRWARKKQQKSLKMALTAKAHFGILIKLSSDSKKN